MDCDTFRSLYLSYGRSQVGRQIAANDGLSNGDNWHNHLHDCESCGDWYLEQRVADAGLELSEFPCVHLAYHAILDCGQHDDPWDCPDVTIVKTDGGYGVPVRDGGSSFIAISYCPWCGKKID
jgi:hypothetical protein